MLTVGSLFSGIGGFDLGLERAGMRVIWQSEIDPYACAVLRKHWPTVPNLGDIRGITAAPEVDVICGGFPCQPFSSAARGKNVDASLWPEMFRVVAAMRPSWVIAENVTHLERVGLAKVEADLEGIGYQIQTLEIPACAVGLDHRRRRLWILGYADRDGESRLPIDAQMARLSWRGHDPGIVGAPTWFSHRMDRLRCLGNAIVPQIAEIIGRAIVAAEAA